MKKIGIKKFVEEYTNRATVSLKDQYLEEDLEITPYVPFLKKVTLVDKLVNVTMLDKKTGNVKVNSATELLLFTRILIENYTNLEVETDGFYEEYDELKKSGLFDKLIIGDNTKSSLIPFEEIVEFKQLISNRKNDLITNKYEIHAFIREQIDRLTALGEATLSPLADVISKKVDEMPKEELDKIIEFATKGGFKEV